MFDINIDNDTISITICIKSSDFFFCMSPLIIDILIKLSNIFLSNSYQICSDQILIKYILIIVKSVQEPSLQSVVDQSAPPAAAANAASKIFFQDFFFEKGMVFLHFLKK